MAQEEMVFTGDASSLEDEFKKLVKANQELEKQLARTSKQALEQQTQMREALKQTQDKIKDLTEQQKKNNEEQDKGNGLIGKMVEGLTTGLGVKGVEAIQKAVEMMVEYNQELAKAGVLNDDLYRKIQTRLGLSDKDFEEHKANIFKAALNTGSTKEQGFAAAGAIKAEGVKTEDATGPMLQEILKASKATGTDPTTMAHSILGAIRASGEKATLENVQKLTAGAASMQELGSVADPASAMGALKTHASEMSKTFHVGLDQQMAGMAALSDQGMDPTKAADTMYKMTERLSTTWADPKRKAAMEKLAKGLDIKDVKGLVDSMDPSKVGLNQAGAQLEDTLNHLNEESKTAFIKAFMGDKQFEGLDKFLLGRKKMDEVLRDTAGRKTLEEKAKIASTGVGADSRRADLMKDIVLAEEQVAKAKSENTLKGLDLMAEKKLGFAAKPLSYGFRALDATVGIKNAANMMGVGSGIDSLDTIMNPGDAAAPRGAAPAGPLLPSAVASPLVPKGKTGVKIDFASKEDKDKDKIEELEEQLKVHQIARREKEAKFEEERHGRHLTHKQQREVHADDPVIKRLENLIEALKINSEKQKRMARNNMNG